MDNTMRRACRWLLLPLCVAFAQADEDSAPEAEAITAPQNIWQAAMFADRNWVDDYLRRGGDVNARDPNRNTPLLHAVGKGRCEMVDYLAAKGAQVNASGRMGWTPLISATFHGRLDCVAALLKAGARTDIFSDDGFDAALYAVQRQQAQILDVLLRHRANVNTIAIAPFRHRQTLLMAAADQADPAVLETVLGAKPDLKTKDTLGRGAVFYAAIAGRLANLQRLQTAGLAISAVDRDGAGLLHVIARGGAWPMVDWLRQQGLDMSRPDKAGVTPLRAFVDAGNIAVLEPLVAGLDRAQRQAMLQMAADSALQPVVELLVTRGVDIDTTSADGRSVLMRAAGNGHIWLVRYLLRQHANIALRDGDGNTALHHAVSSAHATVELTQLLVQAGADKTQKNNAGQSAQDMIRALASNNEKWRSML